MKRKEDYPLVLTVKEVQEILHVGQRVAYELMDRKGFPSVKFGKLKRVNRDKFFEWLEKESSVSN